MIRRKDYEISRDLYRSSKIGVTIREHICTLRTQRRSQKNDVARALPAFSHEFQTQADSHRLVTATWDRPDP